MSIRNEEKLELGRSQESMPVGGVYKVKRLAIERIEEFTTLALYIEGEDIPCRFKLELSAREVLTNLYNMLQSSGKHHRFIVAGNENGVVDFSRGTLDARKMVRIERSGDTQCTFEADYEIVLEGLNHYAKEIATAKDRSGIQSTSWQTKPIGKAAYTSGPVTKLMGGMDTVDGGKTLVMYDESFSSLCVIATMPPKIEEHGINLNFQTTATAVWLTDEAVAEVQLRIDNVVWLFAEHAVTAYCAAESCNPAQIEFVKIYLDGELVLRYEPYSGTEPAPGRVICTHSIASFIMKALGCKY